MKKAGGGKALPRGMMALVPGVTPPTFAWDGNADVGEIDHVLYLVRRYAEYAAYDLSHEEWDYVRANNVVITLARQLIAALDATEIPERGLNDYHSILLSELQNTYEEALDLVFSAPAPGDWTDKKLDELEQRLLRINATHGNVGGELVRVGHQRRKEATAPSRDAALKARLEALENPELDGLIRGCLERCDPMRVKAWLDDYGITKSALYRRIARIKREREKK